MTLKDIIIAGKLTISEGGGGGGSVQTATGTFTGDDTTTPKFPCAFEPDVVYITRLNVVALSERVFAGFIGGTFGTEKGYTMYQHNANQITEGAFGGDLDKTGFTYENGIVKASSSSGRPVSSQCEYYYFAVKWTE